MSQILETALQQASDPQRVADLAENDAALEAEAARVRSDLDYLHGQQARDQRRLQETVQLEQSYHQRLGWNF